MVQSDFKILSEQQINEYSKKIDFFTSEYTVEILAKKVEEGEYTVPHYQRAFTWDALRKSRFIESLLIGLPIPFLFFWVEPESGKLEIVDGSQRLRTLEEYLNNRLELGGLERLSVLNGSKFKDLSLARQRKVLNKSIRGIILSEDTDFESRIDLFERINTGSKAANSAEVRQGALQGPFMDFIGELTKNAKFILLAPVTKKQEKEREREELVSRFFAYSDGIEEYKDNVRPFIFNYIKRMNARFELEPNLKNEYKARFERMLDFVERTFELGFKKSLRATSTPRTRYEAIAIGSHLALEENPALVVSNERANEILHSDGFNSEIRSDGANAKRRLNGRIGFIKHALMGGV
ncbi:DUF262 domain-containing protein [Aeromonas caviae]|uniref:DUF262 domain-containing protein n=1 Tax=Aeromonas caviae TaxID=648 RepID=UPI0038D2041C